MPEPAAPKRKYTRKAAEPTPVPRTRGQALPPEVRNKVWNDRMVLGMTVNATATKNGVSPSYVKNVTLGHADSGPGWRSKTAMVGPVPYRQLKPEAKKAWNDLGYFATRYFGAILMPAHIEACMRFMAAMDTDEKEYIVANMPPGFGKSLCFTRIFPAWLIVRNRAIRMMIVSNTQRNAERYTDSLRRALEQPLPVRASDNDLRLGIAVDAQSSLLKDFGVFKAPNADSGQIWSRKEFQVMQHLGQPVSEKEPTCSAFGMGGQFLGNRLNVVIGDDVYDKSANRTAETRDYFKTWFDANVETRLEPNGLLALVGQRQHADDIYKHCISKRDSLDDAGEEIEDTAEHTKMYQHLTYRAHYDELCTGNHDNLPPYPQSCLLYPNRLKWRDLRKVMTNNPSIFAVEYQQEDMAKGDTLVDKLWVYGGVDPDTNVHYQGVMDKDRGEWELPKGLGWTFNYVTVDPSPTNYWSIQFMAYHPETEQRFLIAHIRKKMPASELLDFNMDSGVFSGVMEEWQLRAKAWGRPIQYWIIEQNAAQRFMLQYDWMKKWQVIRGAQVVAHDTNRNKSDPQYGVQSLASLFKQGKLRLPWRSMDPGRVGSLKLIEEALVWPQGSTDDAIMSLWFGEWNLPRLFAPVTTPTPVFHVPSWVSRGLEDANPVPLMAKLRSVS